MGLAFTDAGPYNSVMREPIAYIMVYEGNIPTNYVYCAFMRIADMTPDYMRFLMADYQVGMDLKFPVNYRIGKTFKDREEVRLWVTEQGYDEWRLTEPLTRH